MPSLQFPQVLLTALLPLFSTLVAGAARQDKAPAWLNDFISFVTPLGAGVINAVANGAPANGNGLAFLAVSALFANLSHAPFLYNIQQELQSRLLSFGVKPAQLQQIEQDITSPQVLKSLENIATLLGSHSAVIGNLLQEFRQFKASVPPTAIGQSAPVALTPNPALSGTNANPTFTIATIPAAPAQVPQQPFPGQALNWTGLELPAAPK